MQDSNQPAKIPLKWASAAGAGYITTIPLLSQIGIANGRASWTDGFPPLNFQPTAAGGVPPFGADFNGVFQAVSSGLQWVQAGAPMPFDGTFATNIGGYPKGSLIPDATTFGAYWLSTVDNNTSDPAAMSGAWQGTTLLVRLLAGPVIRLSAHLAAAGTSVIFTADEIGVATALGGDGTTIASFNKTLNVSTTGAGGMDTGAAPVSGFVSIYAIYNPTSGASALLGTVECQTTIYTGTDMPAGYTMSALVGIWPTNASSQLAPGSQIDRNFYLQLLSLPGQTVLNAGTATSATSVSLSAVVPAAARSAYINCAVTDTNTIDANSASNVGSTNAVNQLFVGVAVISRQLEQQAWIPMVTPQQLFYRSGDSDVQTTIQVIGFGI